VKLKCGHAPGHVRGMACEAFEAWLSWDGRSPEPSVEYAIGYTPRRISISHALGLVWNCTDIVPGHLFACIQQEISDPATHEHTTGLVLGSPGGPRGFRAFITDCLYFAKARA
jgi:hypothetical protein